MRVSTNLCVEERDLLTDVPNAFPYIRCIETEKAGYLIRQYLYGSLYDRIRYARHICDADCSTRPFLEVIEKRWVAFQLLCGLRDCHTKGVIPKSIKQETDIRFITVTSKLKTSS